ncbi:TIGR00730 family Rossman fold protein [Burkholderia ubonensis]|uniref:LOG family protein n=1 Tax=Burkholderia ubonensis TaxID=101571 RepID=UPI0009B47720|nr:TIGR00730 family Rossman fold protein [Burkholderia ubonensis]
MTHQLDACPSGQSRIGQRLHLELDAAKCRLEDISPIVTIYGGARVAPSDSYYDATTQLAHQLSTRGISVMSGGGPGIMEAANKGAKAGQQGLSIGLNIALAHEQKPNAYQDIELSFEHFSSRKATFCKYAAAFVVMPGGFGTLDELFEVLTLIQTSKSRAAPVILYGREFWQGLVTWMDQVMVTRGLVSASEMRLFSVVDTVDEALSLCEAALQGEVL